MSDITLTAGVRQNLLSLQKTADLLNLTQNRLATGKKVNSAFDNPSAFFTSQSLTNRASDLSNLLDQIGQAQQTLNAANTGLTSLTQLLQQALSTAKQAQAASVTYGSDVGTLSGTSTIGTAAAGNLVVNITGGASYTVAIAGTDTVAQIDANFNAVSGLGSSGAITATTDSSGHIKLVANNASTSFTVTASSATAAVGLTADSSTTFTAASTSSSTRTTSQTNYNSLLTQIDQLASDSSYNGVNLLTGDNLKVTFDETGKSFLNISGVTFNSNGLGLSSIAANGFQSDTALQSTIDALNTALTTVRSQSATFGTNASTIQIGRAHV